MRAKPIDKARAERLDDRALAKIVKSRATEVGIPVDLAALPGRLPNLDAAQRFADLQKRDRHPGRSEAETRDPS
ncbi:MAG: hypothetical protein K2Z25_20750 [Beijerinckiaceae bacterium]|nr:hypothetical protein [Beijerinckiaceae bacterium]